MRVIAENNGEAVRYTRRGARRRFICLHSDVLSSALESLCSGLLRGEASPDSIT